MHFRQTITEIIHAQVQVSNCVSCSLDILLLDGSNINGRINGIANGFPNGTILPSTPSLPPLLDPIDELGDISDSASQSYLGTRRATIWSNGSLVCETTLPPSTYWETSMCISVAPSPYTINCDPPPPWSPPEDMTLSEFLGLNPSSTDNNNNDRHDNLNLNDPPVNQPVCASDNQAISNGHIDQNSPNGSQLPSGESSGTQDSGGTVTELRNV